MKLYQQLEQVFKLRINSNNEIIPYIKTLAEMGKFDEPKKVAAIAILLDRLGKLEDEAMITESLKNDTLAELAKEELETPPTPEVPVTTEATTAPEAPSAPETTEQVQPPAETPPVETPAPDGTISELTPENITNPPTPDATTTS